VCLVAQIKDHGLRDEYARRLGDLSASTIRYASCSG